MKTHFRPERTRDSRPVDRERDGTPGRLVPRDTARKVASLPTIASRRKVEKRAGKDIRPDYRLTLIASLAVALLLMVTAFRIQLRNDSSGLQITLDQQEVVSMEEIAQTQQVDRPPPPPRPPVPVEVPNDEILNDVDLDLDASLDLMDPVSTLPPPPPAPAQAEDRAIVEEPEPEIFVVVEQMPEIIGGPQKVYEYLEYPPIARQAGMEGLVVIQVIVDPQGIPRDPVVVRSAGEVLDRAAGNAVMQLRFLPGKQRGRAVSVRMAIPIRFRLKDS